MLLPIVLLLATAGPIQQTDNVAAASTQSASSSQPRTLLTNPRPNRFVIGPRGSRKLPDEGIIIPRHPRRNNNGCLSITAYVFSDGENPELQYVTDCPNLDVPYQTQRAQHKLPDNDPQPDLKRTEN